jgi:hypothetical protein
VSITLEFRGAGDAAFRAVVGSGLVGLRAALAERERSLPAHVEAEFEAWLACGDPKRGFAWLSCDDCRHARRIAFSCKRRGFCPSCAGRRMAERAAHWIDRVIPVVATRQYVLTVPWKRRYLLARRPDLANGVLRVTLRAITQWQRKATGRRRGQSGAVVAIQRFGSALNLNLHFHIVHLDGLYDRGGDGRLHFFRAPASTEDIENLVVEIALGAERWLAAQGFAGEAEDSTLDDDDDAQALLQQASLLGQLATGPRAGARVRRVQRIGGIDIPLPPRCATVNGYNLHANVAFPASDRDGLERLCRYVLRPALAAGRVERLDDGNVRVGLKRAWSDGSTAIELTPTELAGRLAALVPPPRAHQVVYAGVLAGHAAWRKEVVPRPPQMDDAARAEARARKLARKGNTSDRDEDVTPGWAELLRRVFAVDGWLCPGCARPMRLRAVVVDPRATSRVLGGLQRATGPPGERGEREVQGA